MYYMGYMGFGWLWFILFWAAVIWLIVWLINKNKPKDTPLQTIKNRYAKGEITKKQYDEMKKELSD